MVSLEALGCGWEEDVDDGCCCVEDDVDEDDDDVADACIPGPFFAFCVVVAAGMEAGSGTISKL